MGAGARALTGEFDLDEKLERLLGDAALATSARLSVVSTDRFFKASERTSIGNACNLVSLVILQDFLK
jgi:hypothetical protein